MSPSLSLSHSPRPVAAPSAQVPVVLAMSTVETRHFFGTRLPELPGATVTLFDCVGGQPALIATLEAVRPEVIILGWAAPSLPTSYFERSDCPVRYICFATGSARRVPRLFIERGGWVSNWGDGVATMVAEHALLLLLATLRRLPDWPSHFLHPASLPPTALLNLPTRSLVGRTVCLHGFGQIAREIIRMLSPFHVRVRAYSEGVPASYVRDHGAEPAASLDDLFDHAEILIECEALTAATQGSVGAAQLDRLAPQAVFVNVGRGAVVDEAALIERAISGRFLVALDVFCEEPITVDSRVRQVPGSVLSPHIAGPTRDRLPDLGQRAINNVRRYLAGQQPLHLVTTTIYDRST